MKLIADSGYSIEERELFKGIIFSNMVQAMQSLLQYLDAKGISIESQNSQYTSTILSCPSEINELTPNVILALQCLWNDQSIKSAVSQANEFRFKDNTIHFFESLERITTPNFVPSDQDILRARIKTTGIRETTINFTGTVYRMFDVGGQRSERKKWIHCFENVTAVIFMAAISEYDQVLLEDETVNRMQESLTLFESICNSKWFVQTSIILFLNKTDLFQAKLAHSPLSAYFPDYQGGSDYEQARNYILDLFLGLNRTSKPCYSHFTCATETTQIKFVMAAVNDIIIHKKISNIGLL